MELLTRTIDQLPDEGECVWQGVWLRLPGWIAEEDIPPTRPWSFTWINPAVGKLGMPDGVHLAGARPVEAALKGLISFARDPHYAGSRPTLIEVNDAALAEALTGSLAGSGIEVVYQADLPIVKELQSSFAQFSGLEHAGPGILEGEGVTIEQVRSFADAAARFYEAAPWEHLTTNDPIAITTDQGPKPSKALSVVAVMGAEDESFGLSFYESIEMFKERAYPLDRDVTDLHTRGTHHWTVLYGPMYDLILPDADLWEDEDLPVAGEEAYPMPVCFMPPDDMARPGRADLLHMEACLRALTTLTEEQLDAGRLTASAVTHGGRVKVSMTLPFVLDPPPRRQILDWGFMPDRRAGEKSFDVLRALSEGRDFESMEELQQLISEKISGRTLDELPVEDTPQGEARELCFQAYDSIGWRKRQLARCALATDPDCAEAYVLLAEVMPNRAKALRYYEQGMEAGERALGAAFFEENAGEFWVMHETRPYMRARAGAADSLVRLGRAEEARAHYWALLDLDSRDCLALRHDLLFVLIQEGFFEDALRLVTRFGEEDHPSFPYAHALLLHERDGDTPQARERLRLALRANRKVADYLLHPGKRQRLIEDPDFEFDFYGPDPETLAYASAIPVLKLVEDTPEAAAWLRAGLKRGRRKRR